MKHKCKKKNFKRTWSHKKLMFINLSISLIRYGSIKTTIEKAKLLRRFVEPIINKTKENNLSAKRFILKYINDRKIIKKLFDEIRLRYKERNGGYTRIIRFKYRKGDGACIALISLV